MKRFVWLFLATFCLAVAQVQPVGSAVPAKPKCCCDCNCKCGMPACALPVAAAPSVFDTARPLTVARPQPARENPAVPAVRTKFFASFVLPAVPPPVFAAPVVAPAASVPLFQAHCSFLI